MALKDDLKAAIVAGLHEAYPQQSEDSFGEATGTILDRVWATLEKVVGSAQEKLFEQLTAARTELEASRRREAALAGTVRDLHAQLETQAEETGDE